jgi:hypothetical protein
MGRFALSPQAGSGAMFKWKKTISALQIIAILVAYPIFFYLAPWATSRPVSDLTEMRKQELHPPSWASSYSVNHGRYTWYETSPQEAPFRALLLGGALTTLLAFCISSSVHFTKLEEQRENSAEPPAADATFSPDTR